MGLDMYFYLRTKEAVIANPKKGEDNWKAFSNQEEEAGKTDPTSYPEGIKELADYIYQRNFKSENTDKKGRYSYQVGYFRKFNALHSYIVNHFGKGIDHCQVIKISEVGRKQLLKDLNEVLNAKDNYKTAEKLLPTKSGFFFGSTSYNEYYYEDVKDAIELFEKIGKVMKKNKGKYDLIYQASWQKKNKIGRLQTVFFVI